MDAMAETVDRLAQQLDVSPGRVRSALERLEADGLIELRIVEVEPVSDSEEMAAIRAAGRGKCLCSIPMIESVLIDRLSCGRGGCPYGGDF